VGERVLGAMHQHRARVARRPAALAHPESQEQLSAWLFRTYAVQDLPRTENDLE
jgi:hypothetical protein